LNKWCFENVVDFSLIDVAFIRFLLGFTPRCQPLGFWTYLKRLGLVADNNSRKSCSQTCPVCGSEMKFLGFSRVLPEDVDGFILDRSGWVRSCSSSLMLSLYNLNPDTETHG
jgi:hypothetical protein